MDELAATKWMKHLMKKENGQKSEKIAIEFPYNEFKVIKKNLKWTTNSKEKK